MTSLTIFTWGYDGWGSSTRQLKDAVDTIEQGRGFKPPYFVDLRISRSVRAEGLKEKALVYRPQFVGHRIEPYAALATG